MVIWNSDADAKLFLGVLNQLKDAKLNIDYAKLAEFMGPDCLVGAVKNRIVRLRKQAEESSSPGAASEGDGSPAPVLAGTPLKRKPGCPAGASSKKQKNVDTEEDVDSNDVAGFVKKEEGKDTKAGIKEECEDEI
ncbi:hypothetical protein ASPWEDRAFT_174993 [Aspergillus wentii DTO 134E9]|uniref:Uncharacterized protein n=1 Tax=Aspergillus wentii DTO 134E9 TaxID=1073089 RepID=A0A1L9RFE2_ASPWE|nr:uncharacterized protein ASPWEDRAFT_174993 [Aspergillus wentii DTO 134E9]KAI9926264.1 hypothetical protein MW887_004728 [Aspergillus wentii]OJJ33593.1 hypothetical protein ASPWEDRAFT_174993 [Aspergillus wentii DTO 134E9]